MQKYIDRLVKCGYTKERAYQVCCDFVRNLPIIELENFVWSMERKTNVY